MAFTIGTGKLTAGNIVASFCIAKIIGIACLFTLKDKLDLDAGAAACFGRCAELLIFISLTMTAQWPQRISTSFYASLRGTCSTRFLLIAMLAIIPISVACRYLIEWVQIGFAVIGNPAIIEAARLNDISKGSTVVGWVAGIKGLNVYKLTEQLILAPFAEEVIYRGIILTFLTSKFKPSVALLISSSIFSVFHANPIGAFLAGICFGLLFYWSGSVFLCFIAHATANCTILVLNFFSDNVFPLQTKFSELLGFHYFIYAAAVIFVALITAATIKVRPAIIGT